MRLNTTSPTRAAIDIAVGLPTRLAAGRPDLLREWIARIEAGPFSSLAAGDRVVEASLEPLAVLATAAGMTRQVRLLASVVVAPNRETTLLARQAASIDAISNGRLTLGLGLGARPGDYAATGSSFATRGLRFDEQLERLRAIWRGEGVAEDGRSVGPSPARPGGPELLIGGYVDAVVRRVVAWGDGFMAPGGGDPGRMAELWARTVSAWADAGREGRPRWVAGSYFALGPDAGRAARAYVEEAYGHDPELAARRLRGVPTTPSGVLELVERQAAQGVDELVLRPCSDDPDEVDRLAELVPSAGSRSPNRVRD
ncbi:MAG TPA: LLM class flavin-dependent oxidoreductase [Candidatus Limnocylindrales bacterium]|nr:LLM class flavin-dependent oxidoreductase [Candidatus Limnocylindrales bacterium]